MGIKTEIRETDINKYNNRYHYVSKTSYIVGTDIKHGLCQVYRNNRLAYEQTFDNNRHYGAKKHYFENGVLKSYIELLSTDENTYIKDGEFIQYNQSGMIKLRGYYSNDIRVGLWYENFMVIKYMYFL